MTRQLTRFALALSVILVAMAPTSATAFDEVTQNEINNARDAARDGLSAWITKGESVRGASGPMLQLLTNSGDLICETWIVSFSINLRNLVINGAPDDVIQKMHDLLHKVEAACAEKPSVPLTPGPNGGGGGVGGGDDGGGSGGGTGGGTGFTPRPGWTIDDEICWRRCADKWQTWKDAEREANRLAKSAADAAKSAADAAKAAAAADQAANDAEQKQQDAKKELLKPHGPGADAQHLRDLNSAANVDVGKMRDAAKQKHEAADAAAKTASTLAASAAAARTAADAALAAYEACMKGCYDQARAARGQTSMSTGTGVSFGVRTGIMLPLGSIESGTSLSNEYAFGIPIQLDAGWRMTPNVSVGAYGAFGIMVPASAACPQTASCSGWDLRVGVEGQYAFSPGASIQPWAGVGVGYEIAHFSASQGAASSSGSLHGFELLHLTGGADWKLTPHLRAGPMALFSLGQFTGFSQSTTGLPDSSGSVQQTTMHEWVQIGARGVFDL